MFGQAGDQGAEIGQGGVVGDRGQAQCAEEQGGRPQAGHHGLQPPLLHAAQHHQAGQEEADQQTFLQDQRVLVAVVSLGKAEEQQEQAEEQHRMVGQQHHRGEEGQVDQGHQRRHAHRRLAFDRGVEWAQVGLQEEGDDAGVDQNGDQGAPAEVQQHVGAVPAPGSGHHQHRRRGIGGERPADRYVNEQHAQRPVLQPLGHTGAEHGGGQHQGRQRHRGRLRDERAGERHQGQAEPGLRDLGTDRHQSCKQAHQGTRGLQHRPRGGHHHHDEHEQRLGVVARLGVVDGGSGTLDQGHGQHQDEGPEAKHDLDLAQQVEQSGVAWIAVREHLEQVGGEGMEQGDDKQDQADLLDGHGHGWAPGW
jgi:hypothetical protein